MFCSSDGKEYMEWNIWKRKLKQYFLGCSEKKLQLSNHHFFIFLAEEVNLFKSLKNLSCTFSAKGFQLEFKHLNRFSSPSKVRLRQTLTIFFTRKSVGKIHSQASTCYFYARKKYFNHLI